MVLQAFLAVLDNTILRSVLFWIFSVISRKGGRLSELSDKKYILRKESKWGLTLKGNCLSLTLYEESEIKQVLDINKVPNVNFVNIMELVKKIPLMDALLSTPKGRKYVKETLSALGRKQSSQFNEAFLFKIRDATRDMASKGVDIDSMDMMEFTLLLGTNISSWMTDTILQKPVKAK